MQEILSRYDLAAGEYTIEPFGTGLINATWKISRTDGERSFILQRINTAVFNNPGQIAENVRQLKNFFDQRFPHYLFVAPLADVDNRLLVPDADGNVFRLIPFVDNSVTIDVVMHSAHAYEAAAQFGKFTRLLREFNQDRLQYTLPDFHNLSLRITQFEEAVANAPAGRKAETAETIDLARRYRGIADRYDSIVAGGAIPRRVIHHDTKISNVLFDRNGHGLCVIDLDTVMPGYFISDVGDMMRTYLSPANEEEQDLDKIEVRTDFLRAIADGYLSEMGGALTEAEQKLFFYSGEFMIYMQALRFLTDHLNGDTYYGARYPGHNFMRAKNQFVLLARYLEAAKSLAL
ncbi:phosphotransferase enzyme family protein [Hufsiella ginkgonis]|uniref:Phosphotransferase n=1 Tax=Hufsiella ginkgonis TaxID=2695274 RepID=A0A7K1XZD8_9SPHI|nr:aminoglycoside phosphotransferase family protein [Hufsiella ginkgonis]MXV16312.1 phosphotransferase [Hufsiella ginkgonis]